MEMSRLPVDAVAAAVLGGLVGALFVVFNPATTDVVANTLAGSLVFGSLGAVRWIHRLTNTVDA